MSAFFQIFYKLTIALIVILGKLGRENRSNFPFLSLHCSGSLSSFLDLLWVSNENFQSRPSKLHTWLAFLICSHLFLQPCTNSVMSEAQTTSLKDLEVRFYLSNSLSAYLVQVPNRPQSFCPGALYALKFLNFSSSLLLPRSGLHFGKIILTVVLRMKAWLVTEQVVQGEIQVAGQKMSTRDCCFTHLEVRGKMTQCPIQHEK